MVLRHALTVETAETPLQARRRGESERAIGLAKQWLERDYKLGTLWLLLLAWSWEVKGERELAKRCLKEISQWWQGKTLEKLGGVFEKWQVEMAKFLLGELMEVEGWMEVGLQVLEDGVLKDLAHELAQKRKFEEAMEVAKGIEDALSRSAALREIATVMAKVGMMEKAKEVFEEAIEVAKGIEDARGRSEALREIATEMVKAGEFERAMEVAKGIEYARERSEALIRIAAEMAKVGMVEKVREVFEEAIEAAKGIEYARERSEALAVIAAEMAKAGMVEKAREVFEEAMEVAKGIEDAEERSRALAEIAAKMAEVGMVEKAGEAIKQAWQDAKQAASFDRLWEVAETAAKIGLTQKAIEFARQIVGERTWGLRRVLYALTGRGEKDGVKGLLALCGWAIETAIHACECLIRLYPDHVVSIAEVVQELAS